MVALYNPEPLQSIYSLVFTPLSPSWMSTAPFGIHTPIMEHTVSLLAPAPATASLLQLQESARLQRGVFVHP